MWLLRSDLSRCLSVKWGEGSSIFERIRTYGPGDGKVEENLVDCGRKAEENCRVKVICTE